MPPPAAEGILGRPFAKATSPRRILVLRFHAFGDAVITLPVLSGLRDRFPDAHIGMATSTRYAPLFSAINGLDSVHPVSIDVSRLQRVLSLRTSAPDLDSPDLVLDLQRSRLSRLLTRLLRPRAWVAFDRYAPKPAIERYLDAVSYVGITGFDPSFSFSIAESIERAVDDRFGPELERGNSGPLVCLNPAGNWATKSWPPERYAELGRRMIRAWNARIVLVGTENAAAGAAVIERELGDDVINLVSHTSPAEALALVRRLSLMVSDDSGLMHLAWTNRVPTLGIFGASRGAWSRPCGPHTRFLGSEDLECGACMQSVCGRGDRICLTRVSVERAFGLCEELIRQRDSGW